MQDIFLKFYLKAVDCGFKPRSGQTKDYEIGLCWFSAKLAALRSKCKDWMAQNQNNMSEWSDMSTRRLLFQWTSTKADLIIISLKINWFSPWYSWKIAELALNNSHSLTLKCRSVVCTVLTIFLGWAK